MRTSTNTSITAGGALFLVAVSVYDRDPTPFTWLLVAVFLAILGFGVYERSKGN